MVGEHFFELVGVGNKYIDIDLVIFAGPFHRIVGFLGESACVEGEDLDLVFKVTKQVGNDLIFGSEAGGKCDFFAEFVCDRPEQTGRVQRCRLLA